MQELVVEFPAIRQINGGRPASSIRQIDGDQRASSICQIDGDLRASSIRQVDGGRPASSRAAEAAATTTRSLTNCVRLQPAAVV
jgi:hypothetical protein